MATSKNPLFPDSDQPEPAQEQPAGYVLPSGSGRIEPLPTSEPAADDHGRNPAVQLIKEKLAHLYDAQEPDAERESREAEAAAMRSPHQQFMHELTTSGLSLAEIQTRWHNYYTSLPDEQKHQVWQEFYDANAGGNFYQPRPVEAPAPSTGRTRHQPTKHTGGAVVAEHRPDLASQAADDTRKPAAIRQAIRGRVGDRARLSQRAKHNLHSLMFGLAAGFVVLFIVMFGFFNQMIIAPFIQPGRAEATPIIIDSNSIAANGKQEIIIPKINVEIPVDYGLDTTADWAIMASLHHGVVHYPNTELPGQKGNTVILGHSSSNILSVGRYKFAFVLLHELQPQDKFYLTYKGKVYTYEVVSKKVVPPSQTDVLDDIPGETATATLITCDPPGTSINRLVVVGRQISPNPAGNSKGNTTQHIAAPQQIAGDGLDWWSRFMRWLF